MPTRRLPRVHRAGHAVRPFVLFAATLAAVACAGGDGGGGPIEPTPRPGPPLTLGLTAAPAAVTVVQGESVTATISLTRGGHGAAVSLGAAAPAGVAAALAPATVPAGATESVLTLATTATTPAGEQTVTINGAGGGANATTTLLLRVIPAPRPGPAPSYVIAVSPSPVTVTAGGEAAAATVALTRTNFTGGVTLTTTGAPAGLTVAAAEGPLAGDAGALTVRAAGTLAAGDYPVTVVGTAAGLAPVTAGVVVRVAAAPAPVEAGVVTGVALDARGRPLAGALVQVKMVFNSNVVTARTGADGRYRVAGLAPALSHQVKAWSEVEYRGRAYCVRLGMPAEADYDAFVPAAAVTRDFRWQLTGRIPDARANAFGAAVDVDTWDVDGIRTGDDIEVTFTPLGPLVDGSEGTALTRVVRFGVSLAIEDVPHGAYTVTAALVRDGARVPLRVARAGFGGTLAAATTVEWEPEIAGAACGQSLGPALRRFPLKVSNR